MIYILWCTIRPDMFIETHSHWINTCKNKEQVKTKVAVNMQQHKEMLEEYAKTANCEIYVVGNDRIGASYPTYCLTSSLQAEKKDIVVLCSDDFYSPEGWDDYLIEKFKDFSGCLTVRDGYHETVSLGIHPITIPIMTFECLEKLNKIICHPAYVHMFADSELYMNVKELGLLKDERDKDMTVFEHRHYITGKRQADQYDNIYRMYWAQDSNTFDQRMRMPIEERLKV